MEDFNWIEAIDHLVVGTHVIAGFLALGSGFLAMIVRKGGDNHRLIGKTYFWSMFYIFLSTQITEIFFRLHLFIFFISIISFYQAFTGYRVLSHKGRGGSITWLDWVAAIGCLISGIAFFIWSTNPIWAPRADHPPSIFVPIGALLGLYTTHAALSDIVRFVRPPSGDKNWWWYHHMHGMLHSYIGAWVAFGLIGLSERVSPAYNWLFWVVPSWGGTIGAFVWVLYYKRKFNRKRTRTPLPVADAVPSVEG